MKRGIVAVLGLAFAVLVGFGLFGTQQASANHAAAPDEITISLVGSPLVAVGSDATIALAVTTSTTPHKSIQWELAYGANLSWAAAGSSAVYTCTNPGGINYPSETDTPPVESPLVPGVTNLGTGANCASLSGTFAGAAMTGTFVTVKLRCLAAGNTFVSMRPATEPLNPANDVNFGTTLGDAGGNNIPTTLENQVAIPGFGNQAAVGLACATPVDYSVAKTATASVTGDAGTNTISTTISITNPDAAAHPTVLVDNLPGGVTGLVVPAGCLQTGPSQVTCGYPVNGNVPTAANSTDTYTITYNATPAQECGSLSNTVTGGPGDSSTADANTANNVATAVTAVDCPVLSVTKTTPTTSAFTDDLVTYTITVSNDAGSIANNVVLNDALGAGQTFVSATPPCAAGFPCNLGNIPGGGSVVITVVVKMPPVAANACDTASATQNAPGVGASSAQVCVTVKSKFPTINGIAKDTGVTPVNADGTLNQNFQFSVGNIFLCKPFGSANSNLPPVGAFSGAGETACGIFKIAEVGQAPTGTDTCNDDDDGDGRPCKGDPTMSPAPYQDAGDFCLNLATDYMPGQTLVDCGTTTPGTSVAIPNGYPAADTTNESAEGLGAFEFQVKFDDKLFQSPTFTCNAIGNRYVAAQVSIITENWVQFGCISKSFPFAVGTPESGAQCTGAGLGVDDDADGVIDDGCTGSVPGPDISGGAVVLGYLTLQVQPDLFSRMRPAKDNGVSTNLLDENCEFADTLGQPYDLGLGTYGNNQAPSGGLTKDCKDAAITIRMLEGDIDLNCTVDIRDDQGIAFRYGQFFGQLNYNRFFDIEPGISPDFDIDIKDVQTVFGRNGSTCAAPIPAQPPLTTIPDP